MIKIFLAVFLLPSAVFAQCNSLRRSVDKFSGDVYITSPIDEAAIATKSITREETFYSLILSAPATASATREGAIVLLEDGKRMEWLDKPVMIRVESYHPRYNSVITARSFITLTADQVQQLAERRITDYKLYVFDWTLRKRLSDDLKRNIGCLLKAK